uniref:RRM domain-containing protein n=1 Tax=Pygocentrus nattereri TaxID=42514 RepID=A0AAR2JDU7_PYGNA
MHLDFYGFTTDRIFSCSEVAVSNAGQDYVVGLVSSSLGAKQTTPSTGSLSSLFSSASSNTLVFVPAAKVEQKTSCVKPEAGQVASSKEALKQKKTPKEKSAAEKKLQSREAALENADNEDVEKSPKKVKHKAPKLHYDRGMLEDEQPAKRRKIQQNPAEERIKLKRTVFVGNLPVNCKKKDLKRIFRDLGGIESVRFRSVVREDPSISRRLATIQRQVDPKRPSINAYVVFKEEEGAVNHDHKRSVFVGNLPYDIMELPLRKHFEECGKVEAVRLVRDHNSGVGKGFGYVLFENADSVMLALKLNGSQLLDRTIRVKRSVKKEKEKKSNRASGRNAKGQSGKGAGRRKGPQPGSFKGAKSAESNKSAGQSFKKGFGRGNKTSTSFTGEMVDPSTKKGKGLKKRFKPKKNKPANI